MPKVFLYGPVAAQAITLTADNPAADGSYTIRTLDLPGSSAFTLGPVTIDHKFTEIVGAGPDIRLKQADDGSALSVQIPYALAAAGDFQWFGAKFGGAVAVAAELVLTIPATGAVPQPDVPFVAIRVCGAFQVGVDGAGHAVFTSNVFCCQVEIPQIPATPSSAPAPGFRLRLPNLGIEFPRLSLPWNFPNFPALPFRLPGFSLPNLTSPISVSYDSVDAGVDVASGVVTIDIHHLRIGKGPAIEADLHIVFDIHGQVDTGKSSFRLYRPDFGHTTELPISNWHIGTGCLLVGWNPDKFQDLLALVLPDFSSHLDAAAVTLRILSGAGGIREIRLDWSQPAASKLSLPGFDVQIDKGTFSLVADIADSRLFLALTLPAGGGLTATSPFSFSRPPAGPNQSSQTELLRDKGDGADFVTFKAPAIAPVTILLADLPTGSGSGIRFLRQLQTPLTPLVPFQPDCTPVAYAPISLQATSLNPVTLTFNTDAVQLPFLRNEGSQFLTVQAPSQVTLTLGNDPVADIPLTITINVGQLSFATQVTLKLHLESFAFTIDDTDIPFLLTKPFNNQSLFGLNWSVVGAAGKTQNFEVFRLQTKDSNYLLKQSPDCVFNIEYSAATSQGQPILFSVTNLAIGPRGIDLDASVTPRPARLSGVDTEFSFTQGSFQIRANQIQDFTIAGSGPLPPALVGSATASIALQFHQTGGSLKLVSGAARLDGKNLLKCQGTRFQFSVDALGLKFVDDGSYHLYFTITGTARFVPQDGDDASGPLAWLPGIELRLMECPLTGDARVISQHVQFLITLPKKVTFSILGCFEMEVRGIGFVPQAPMFDAYASAMRLAGQIRFADGDGDALDARIDFHDLFIGLPAPGDLFPRLYCKELGVKLHVGDAFDLDGMVDFLDNEEIQPGITASGFRGQGSLTIQGLPTLSVSFAFLRVRPAGTTRWDRAWFVYAQVSKVSFEIPVIEVFIREIGLGFGYRYTLAMIQASDTIQDPKQLIAHLETLSLSQGELASFDQWRVDDTADTVDPRWTVVFRAMIAESSATQVPTEWIEEDEKVIPCLFLLDTVVALRSDLTFLMTARGWLFTNYWDYVNDTNGVRRAPLVTGFVLLSPRQSRFLAHVASNPGAQIGGHPPVPDMFMDAFRSCHYTATLLIQPGLLHAELGWSNMLTWSKDFGPLRLAFSGGAIFRVSSTEIVTGVSFQARGSLDLQARVDLGFIGAQLAATAQVALGARYIGVLALKETIAKSAYYSVQGIDIRVTVKVQFWLKINVLFGTIEIDFSFSFDIAITVALQVGLLLQSPYVGIRAAATIGINIMGHGLNFGISIAVSPKAVDDARTITNAFLNVGLEATDALPIPGEPPEPLGDQPPAPGAKPPSQIVAAGATVLPRAAVARPPVAPQPVAGAQVVGPPQPLAGPHQSAAVPVPAFIAPHYSIFSVPPKQDQNAYYFVLIPSATRINSDDPKLGFLPPPPITLKAGQPFTPTTDFEWTLPGAVPGLQQFTGKTFQPQNAGVLAWKADWDSQIGTFSDSNGGTTQINLRQTMRYAYTLTDMGQTFGDVTPIDDPNWSANSAAPTRDDRLEHANESAYEAAVRGASDQVTSPRFRPDPSSPYDQAASAAWSFQTNIYQSDDDSTSKSVPAAVQMRSATIQQMIRDVANYAANPDKNKVDVDKSVAFRFRLVFSVPKANVPDWLLNGNNVGDAGTIRQRRQVDADVPDAATQRKVSVFNTDADRFDNPRRPPVFDKIRQFSDDNTIAISWDLVWPNTTAGNPQTDPEHHLAYYLVRRKPLDSSERAIEYPVRPADVLHREGTSPVLTQIRTRFHIVDHFNNETAEQQAQMPSSGKSYLYTITPVDIAGHVSLRPLSLVATRFPKLAPPVPAGTEIMVTCKVPDSGPSINLKTALLQDIADPVLVFLTPPVVPPGSPRIEAKSYQLWFRREQAIPVGSYGLGSAAQGSQAKGLPVSNARPLRTDIAIPLASAENPDKKDPRKCYAASLADLKKYGIVAGDGVWRPDSWLVFLQAGSPSDVWSSLAPVQPILAFTRGTDPATVVRRPATLEFIAQPVPFGPLPPEDTKATPGIAEVPMPVSPLLDVAKDLIVAKQVAYRTHPEKPRAIEFVWNQAPADSGTPPDLQAGFSLYELDLDAHTTADLADGSQIESSLRHVQEIELLPRDQVALIPANTQQTQRWEAWYAASLQRAQIAVTNGLNLTYSNWFSWRDSDVVWPPLHDMLVAGKLPRMHPFLQQVVDALKANVSPNGLPWLVDVVPIPTSNITDLAGFIVETAESTDPYGWRLLQRLGLSICFRMRDPATGDPNPASDTIAKVRSALAGALPQFDDLKRHVHLELLFQPGASVQLQDAPADAASLLDAVQLSLRPVAQEVYVYRAVDITHIQSTGLGKTLALTFCLLQEAPITVCATVTTGASSDQAAQPAGQWVIGPDNLTLAIAAPASGKITLLLRSQDFVSKPISVQAGQATVGTPQAFDCTDQRAAVFQAVDWLGQEFSYTQIDVNHPRANERLSFNLQCGNPIAVCVLAPNDVGHALIDAGNASLTLSLAAPPPDSISLLLRSRGLRNTPVSLDAGSPATLGTPAPFSASDPRVARFAADDLNSTNQWSRLRTYLQMAKNTSVPGTNKVTLPPDGQLQTEPDLLPWLQRFLDYAPPTQVDGQPAGGPWIATAYPRLVSPLPATPDNAGRITCIQLVADQYAHAYRYYVRPRGRYDALWQAVLASPPFSTGAAPVKFQKPLQPDPKAGGLDVVLHRVREVAQPVILSSRLISLPAAAGQIHPPAIWEVIVARHPEQSLAERNWTAARQLAWGQMVYTLLRTFAFQSAIDKLNQALGATYKYQVQFVEDLPDRSQPLLPGPYPPPDQERLKFILGGDLPAVDFPLRFREFGKGALVVQYRGTPYFYKQQFIAAAQAGCVVSKPSAVIQRDFEYISPAPLAWMDAVNNDTGNSAEGRSRVFNIQLASYWDCSPESAQKQWTIEAPTEHDAPPVGSTALRKYSSLPDTSVLYQLVFHRSAGVSETVAEFYFDAAVPGYKARSLSPVIEIAETKIQVPAAKTDRQAPMILAATMKTGEQTRRAGLTDLLNGTPDLRALTSCPDAGAADALLGAFMERYYPARAISQIPNIPAARDWQNTVEIRLADAWVLASDMDYAKPGPLEDWASAVDTALAGVIRSLKAGVPVVIKPLLAASDIPVPLRHSLRIAPSTATWASATSDALLQQFDTLLPSLPVQSPARTALTAIRGQLNTLAVQPAAPATFNGTLPDKTALATLLGNPLTHVTVAGADNAWTISCAGVNLGEPCQDLIDRLEIAIPDATDNRRQALEAVFNAVAAFSAAAPIPDVPANLVNNVLLAPWLLHLRTPLPPNGDLKSLFQGSPPNQASMDRLLGDVAKVQNLGQELAPWTCEEAVSSHGNFNQPDVWQDRLDFPVPEACELHVEGVLSPDDAKDLLTIQADTDFNNALAQLAAGKATTVRVTLGIEQLAEISSSVNVIAASRTVVWRGPLRPAQFVALNRWIQVSSFRGTFAALLDALQQFTLHVPFDKGDEYPRTGELSPSLAGRLSIARDALDWQGLALDADQELALQNLVNDSSFGHPFHFAILSLLDTLRHTATVTVPISESFWAPRPRQGEHARDQLLIGNARIRSFGLMLRTDTAAQPTVKIKPDVDAVARLLNNSLGAGLNGAGIEVRARLGSAGVEARPILNGPAQGA